MSKYKLVFFDLDGTLTDPGEGITNSVAFALRHYGIDVPSREALYPFIGPPLSDSFARFCGFSAEQAREAVDVYREYFADKGIFENRVYDGIPEMLSALRDAGYTLAVATSKPEKFARIIFDHFSLSDYFAVIAGANMEETRIKKADIIEYALKDLCFLPGECVMVGDRSFDVIGAAHFGMDCIGVTYGYGSRKELEEAGAKYIVGSPKEITDLLL